MLKVTVKQLREALADFDDDGVICVQTFSGSESAIVAIPDTVEAYEALAGRFANAADGQGPTVVVVQKL